MVGGGATQRTNKERLDDLESQTTHILGIVEGATQLAERVEALEVGGPWWDLTEDFRATVEAPRTEMGELTTKVNLLVRAVGTTPAATTEVAKVRIPEPRAYGGARDAKELENFLFDMEL